MQFSFWHMDVRKKENIWLVQQQELQKVFGKKDSMWYVNANIIEI